MISAVHSTLIIITILNLLVYCGAVLSLWNFFIKFCCHHGKFTLCINRFCCWKNICTNVWITYEKYKLLIYFSKLVVPNWFETLLAIVLSNCCAVLHSRPAGRKSSPNCALLLGARTTSSYFATTLTFENHFPVDLH